MNLEIINLLRKTITSLSCIEKTTTDKNLKNEACEYLIDFSYRCIENKENDFVKLGEDIQFGIIELTKLLK